MAVYDFFLSRNSATVTGATYIGHEGRLFYDSNTGELRLSDGSTPGGVSIPITLATSSRPGAVKPNDSFNLAVDGTMSLKPASDTVLGGVKLGPGVILNNEGQIIIDNTDLDFSFGDFVALTSSYPIGSENEGDDFALLQTLNTSEDMVLASNAFGSVNVVGEFRVFSAESTLEESLIKRASFRVTEDGKVRILVPLPGDDEAGLSITGNANNNKVTPENQGIMIQVTGHEGIPSRIYNDAVAGYANFIGRRMNGTSAAPTGVLANDEVARFSANAYTSDAGFGTAGIGQMRWIANENITSTTKGGRLEFWIVPNGTATTSKIATITGSGITLESGKTLTGNVTGDVTGTASTATNLSVANNLLAGTITINPTVVGASSSSIQTFTLIGLTTNHKIVATFGSPINGPLVLQSAQATALNTLSIEFRNNTNQAVNAGNIVVQYFAWV